MKSASAVMAGRRPRPEPMLASCTSIPAGSFRETATAVGTVFSCVASRNRNRGPLGPGTKPPSPPSGPDPLGENQSLSSPPLEPRGLLLSVMRQKVGKERSQGVFAPLAIPRQPPPGPGVPLGTRKLELVLQSPLASAFPYLATNCDLRSRESPPPRAARATFTAFTRSSAGGNSLFVTATLANSSAPQSLSARLGDSFYFAKCEIVESLLRRGARGLEGTALRGRRSLRRTGGASRHPGLAIRARKQSLSARLGNSSVSTHR